MRITAPDNTLLRRLRRLADSPRACREAGRTLAEGVHLIEAVLAAGVPIATLATRGASSARRPPEVAQLVDKVLAAAQPGSGFRHVELPAALYDALSPVEHGAGLLAEIAITARAWPAQLGDDVVYLDAVQDPGNVGALLRTATAAGVRHVVAGEGSAFAWSPKVMRAAMGAHFAVSVYDAVPLADVLGAFRGTVCAADVEGEEIYAASWGRGPTLWLFGAEGQGLSATARAAAQCRLRIPLAAGVESLNVAAAAAVCLFEQVRRRRRV